MGEPVAVVLRHREWRFLVREFIASHPRARTLDGRTLKTVLAPVASLAWWLATFAPDVVEQARQRGSLQVILPGACTEIFDEGRWFGFLPWMLGVKDLESRVWLIGNELARDQDGKAPSGHLSAREIQQMWRSQVGSFVEGMRPCDVFNGLLSQWQASLGDGLRVDACVLFSPGFASHHDTWLTESDLLPLMRKGTPLGVFGYSLMDCLEDQEILGMHGIRFAPATALVNPWRGENGMESFIGSFGGLGWRCETSSVPAAVRIDEEAFRDFNSLHAYMREDYRNFGGDRAFERMGARWAVGRAIDKGVKDAIVVLPHSHGILESTRQLGEFDDKGFVPFEPPILAPVEVMATRPADTEVMRRVLWAIRTHRDWAGPAVEERTRGALLFDGLSKDDLLGGMRDLLREATGREDIDPDDFMREMRAAGGIHGPTHPCWFDLLESMGWEPYDWEESPDRYAHAFELPARRRKLALPVVCEAYAFMPDDAEDDLAREAMAAVSTRYPDGAALLFKLIPYREVRGHKYHFGGMLWWRGAWKAFALTGKMTGLDDVLDQLESGFKFGDVAERYCDDGCSMSIPFNLMCQGMDPNTRVKMMALSNGVWVTPLPAGAA